MKKTYREIEDVKSLKVLLSANTIVRRFAFQNIDFGKVGSMENVKEFQDCIFMGCVIPEHITGIISADSLILPKMNVPFDVFPSRLYSSEDLYSGYESGDYYDKRVYEHYIAEGKETTDIKATLLRTLHDHSVSDALHDFLSGYRQQDVVAVMGGHALKRTDKVYADIVRLSKMLTEKGKLMISGGGPGAMEATHLGAWLAGREEKDVAEAMNELSTAPVYSDSQWLPTAFGTMKKYPRGEFFSIGIPTWFYGHEPATPFATHIAKFFQNSIREDGLLAIAKGGVIYAPGSAGTLQEIFQDAAQNHYETFGWSSPMIFLGEDYWNKEVPVYPLIKRLSEQRTYRNLLLDLSDDIAYIADAIMRFSPQNDN